jgi:2-polyprenyl-3-methyl-5-hydroxy-6-metoxy-1,4-benzoquinol methylase
VQAWLTTSNFMNPILRHTGDMAETRKNREQAFWDDHVPQLSEVIREYEAGPDANTRAMLDALEPLAGAKVLDFACGAGVTSAWLADRGAVVTAIDLSRESTARTAELCNTLGKEVKVVTGEVGSVALEDSPYDRIAGRYALHHLDCAAVAPLLAQNLEPRGTAAFVETMSTNPLLRLARRHVAGRAGIPRYGTADEHPLTEADLAALRGSFESLELRVAQMTFLRIFDRNVLRYRYRRIGRLLGATDDFLLDRLGLGSWSFHQVVIVSRRH